MRQQFSRKQLLLRIEESTLASFSSGPFSPESSVLPLTAADCWAAAFFLPKRSLVVWFFAKLHVYTISSTL